MAVRKLRSGSFSDPQSFTTRAAPAGTVIGKITPEPSSSGSSAPSGQTPAGQQSAQARQTAARINGAQVLLRSGASARQVQLFRSLSKQRRKKIVRQTGGNAARLQKRVARIQQKRRAASRR